MKNLIADICGIAIFIALILGGAEEPDGGMCFPWTLTAIVVIAVLGIILKKLMAPNSNTTKKVERR